VWIHFPGEIALVTGLKQVKVDYDLDRLYNLDAVTVEISRLS
jgi:hypothetical protein